MAHPYLPHTQADIRAMLEKIGVKSLDDLYADVPEGCLRDRSERCHLMIFDKTARLAVIKRNLSHLSSPFFILLHKYYNRKRKVCLYFKVHSV